MIQRLPAPPFHGITFQTFLKYIRDKAIIAKYQRKKNFDKTKNKQK